MRKIKKVKKTKLEKIDQLGNELANLAFNKGDNCFIIYFDNDGEEIKLGVFAAKVGHRQAASIIVEVVNRFSVAPIVVETIASERANNLRLSARSFKTVDELQLLQVEIEHLQARLQKLQEEHRKLTGKSHFGLT